MRRRRNWSDDRTGREVAFDLCVSVLLSDSPTVPHRRLSCPSLHSASAAGAEHFGDGPMCRHCHVYVDTAHLAKLEPKVDEEVYLTEKIHNQTAKSERHTEHRTQNGARAADEQFKAGSHASDDIQRQACVCRPHATSLLLCAPLRLSRLLMLMLSSRFACEIIVNAELEGLTIVVPEYVDRL